MPRLRLDPLEDRSVPALGAGVFAQFEGATGDPAEIPVQVRRADFAMPLGRAVLRFDLSAAAQPVEVESPAGKPLTPLAARADVAGSDAARTVVALGAKAYAVRLPAEAPGAWRLDVTLAGDANGDYRVNRTDLDRIGAGLGTALGEPGFNPRADVDGDGEITSRDLALTRMNFGVATKVRPLAVLAGLSPASDPDGNRIVLRPDVVLAGQARPGVAVRADLGMDGTVDRTGRADAAGRFRLGLAVTPGPHEVSVVAKDGFGQSAETRLELAYGDVVTDWNAVHLKAIRDYTVFSQVPYANRIVHTPPPVAARNLAMVHAAMYDAVNAVERTGRPYRVDLTAPPGTSAEAAAALAAYRVLSNLYPGPEQLGLFSAALAESLGRVPAGPGKDAGVALGRDVADAILAWRGSDGSRAPSSFTPGGGPGDWAPTGPDFLPPQLPQWPGVTPFGVPDVLAFRPPPPPDLETPEYAAAVNEVKELGRFDSPTRTSEQTGIALFWADGPGTATPPGHWNRIAQGVVLRQGMTLGESARLFALLNVAMADAGIASWDAKYHYALWRPIDAVREAGTDGNPLTEPDVAWAPLLKTPPFPSYTSGHSTFSGAAAAVLSAVFGPAVGFSTTSDGQDGFTQRPLAGVLTRTFTSFDEAAEEASRSRVYGGIHYEFDSVAGLNVGRAIGASVVESLLAPP